MRGISRALIVCAAVAFAATCAAAQDAAKYPEQLVRIVVPFSAGSMTDLLARVIADKLATLEPAGDRGEPARSRRHLQRRQGQRPTATR